MVARLKLRGPTSSSLDNFLKSQKNLARTPPRLWPDTEIVRRDPDELGLAELKLSHPLLRALDSCNNCRDFNQVHSQLTVSGLDQHPLAASQVVKKLCSSLFAVSHAVCYFDHLEDPDAFICNTIIRGFVNLKDPYRAIEFYYYQMVRRCVAPNHYTFPVFFKACAEIESVTEGEKAHGRVVKFGFESDLYVRNALIHMYSLCWVIWSARKVFDGRSVLDLVSWNSMIDGYVKNGEVGTAWELFKEMPERDCRSWNSMIAGYVGIGDMESARKLFEIMPSTDVVSWNCMIDGYARIENVLEARQLFERMPLQNVISWNVMLALYVRLKDYSECLLLFDMMLEGRVFRPNDATLVSVLTACANLGSLDRGKWVHSYIQRNNIEPDVLLSTALLTMYAKCGAIDLARDVFNEMPEKSVVSWNSMIMGCGMHGHVEEALELYMQMEKKGPKPNDATFVCVLSACTHSGLVLEGWWYFDLMQRVHKIKPKAEHYGCMVDLLSRAGLMTDSEELIKNMPMNMEAAPALWGALLSACRTHSNSELGEIVAKRLIALKPGDVGPYVLLSNIYATKGKWEEVDRMRNMIKAKGLQKEVGSSLVHVGMFGYSSVGIGSLHRRRMVYSMLSEIGAQLKLSPTASVT